MDDLWTLLSFCSGSSMESSRGDPGSPLDSLGKCFLAMWTPQCYIVSHDADHYDAEDDSDDDDNQEE